MADSINDAATEKTDHQIDIGEIGNPLTNPLLYVQYLQKPLVQKDCHFFFRNIVIDNQRALL